MNPLATPVAGRNAGVPQQVIKIVATESAKVVVKKIAAELGMKEMVVAGRVYEWFSRQDDMLVKGVLGLLPKGYESEVVRIALERLAKGEGGAKGKGR